MKTFVLVVTLLGSLATVWSQDVELSQRPEAPAADVWATTNTLEPMGPPHKSEDVPEYLRKLARQLKKYQKTEKTEVGGLLMGWPGVNGQPGASGRNGLNGKDGVAGATGPIGEPGFLGPAGEVGAPGVPGATGPRGAPGLSGPQGPVGRDGAASVAKWKQCAWNEESDLDVGLIKACNFSKLDEGTHLHVRYSGNLRMGGCSNCCKRWFFTFNGEPCREPLPIDAAVYLVGPSHDNLLRPRSVEGYCHVPAGAVSVGFNVGNCDGFSNSDAFEGWNSVSRIIVEEVPAPQE